MPPLFDFDFTQNAFYCISDKITLIAAILATFWTKQRQSIAAYEAFLALEAFYSNWYWHIIPLFCLKSLVFLLFARHRAKKALCYLAF